MKKIELSTVKEFVQSDTFRRWLVPPLFVAFLIFVFFYTVLWAPNTFDGEKVIVVSRGATFKAVADSLEAAGILRWRKGFELAGWLKGYATSLKVGKYVFFNGASNGELLDALHYGKSRNLIPVVLPEGFRMRSMGRRFAQALGVNDELIFSLCTDSSFIRSLGLNVPSLEGYLLPDTYYFHWQTDERDIIQRLIAAFKEFYDDRLKERQKELKMDTHQVLTLASIVEGEAQIDNERTIIAGVYHNRLKRRMRLEADPTIQYALPDGPRRLLYRDLNLNSPYNTYRNYGLPPGPINNPGRQSILATLFPDDHGYLFFVADGQGGHLFAKTYAEHQRNVNSYRRFRREIQRNAQLSGG